MKRRDFLKTGVVGVAATAATAVALGADEKNAKAVKQPEEDSTYQHSAAPCGLFCEACSEYKKERCHGCGCECGKCIASGHCRQCVIFACVKKRGLESCADCQDFACTNLIMHACDPIWRTHAPCIENLRRRKAIGSEAWIEEQRAYWSDEDKLRKSQFVEAQCQAAVRELRKTGYTKPW
jgi:hypothetical protein